MIRDDAVRGSVAVNGMTLVLLSGGIDSTATLALYRRKASEVAALFIDYGQPAASQERDAAHRVAQHFKTTLTTVQCAGLGTIGSGYIKGRNALLLHLALTAAPFEVGQIALGLHAGTPYVDCSAAFVSEAQRMFDLYCAGRIRVVAPFLNDDKRGVVGFCRDAEVPLHLTYSCERGSPQPCGNCLSCGDRAALHV